jgi:hypothetical protein
MDALGVSYSEFSNAPHSNVMRLQVRSIADVMETLGRLRPSRLQAAGMWEGASIRTKASAQYAVVAEVEPVGKCEVSALGTSTGTFLANGMVSHNTDDFFTWRGIKAGYPCILRTGYAFDHSWAQHKRGAGMTEHQRMYNDERLYHQAQAMVEFGRWREPWPPNGGLPQ